MSDSKEEEEKQGRDPEEETIVEFVSESLRSKRGARAAADCRLHERFKAFYRRLYPEDLHLTTMDEELRPRMTSAYLYTVFQSLLSSPNTNIPTYDSVRGVGPPDMYGCVLPNTTPGFFHYHLLFQAKIETKEVSHVRGSRVDKFLHLRIPNDGFSTALV